VGRPTAGRLLLLLLLGWRLWLPVLLLLLLLLVAVVLLAAEAAVPAARPPCAVWGRVHHVLREGHGPPWVHHHGGHRGVWALGATLLVVVCRAVAAAATTTRPLRPLGAPDPWGRPLQLHHTTSTARGHARRLLLLLLVLRRVTALPLAPVLLLHHGGARPTCHLVVWQHLPWVCTHGWWWCACMWLHVTPRWWVGLHHGWWPPHAHVGATMWARALPVAGCALVAVSGGVVTITVIAPPTSAPIPVHGPVLTWPMLAALLALAPLVLALLTLLLLLPPIWPSHWWWSRVHRHWPTHPVGLAPWPHGVGWGVGGHRPWGHTRGHHHRRHTWPTSHLHLAHDVATWPTALTGWRGHHDGPAHSRGV
jgi:hypothetical protein